MNAQSKKTLDIVVLAITLVNIVLFMLIIIPPSIFLLTLAICAIYTYYIRKRI